MRRPNYKLISMQMAAAAAAMCGSIPARAAEFEVLDVESNSALIFITGEIRPGDDQKFENLAVRFDRAIVILDSPGGALTPALAIGRAINIKGYKTLVPQSTTCASSCALIWLAGEQRLLSPTSQVGFHASYRDENGKLIESGVGNALIGHYLSKLDLSTKSAIFVTQARPNSILWLTEANMSESGIEFDVFDPTDPEVKANADKPAEKSAPKIAPKGGNGDLFQEVLRRAKAGAIYSQNELGLLYYNGQSVQKNFSSAAYWFEQSAKQGLAAAQLNLGMLYFKGEGVIQNYEEALRLFKLAAAQKSSNAQYMLGLMYSSGLGVKRDEKIAYMWFNIAASLGHEKASQRRDKLYLNGKRLSYAQKLSSECVARNYRGC